MLQIEDNSDRSEDETKDIVSNIRAFTESSNFNTLLKENLGAIMKRHNSLWLDQEVPGQAAFLGVVIYPLVGN